MFVKPKQKPNSELNAHWASVRHHIAKPHVEPTPSVKILEKLDHRILEKR